MTHVLLVDDDSELIGMLKDYLEQENFTVTTRYNGDDGVSEALAGSYDAVVLDVMMPRLDGVEALRRIRRQSAVPVLMLTAKGDDMDRILGLEQGADDYVPKPCTARELTARLRAILRRTQSAGSQVSETAPIVIGDLTVRPGERRAEWCGRPLALTSTEYNLLEVLARHAGRPVSKQVLSEQGLGRPLARYDRSIDVHLHSIRQKLGTSLDGSSCIQTVYRRGYQLLKG